MSGAEGIAPGLEPPYFAVVFTSIRAEGDGGYGEMAERMEALASRQPGFLGIESARGPDGVGITVSYWSSRDAIADWKRHLDHQEAQRKGRSSWYRRYRVRVAKVERDYGFDGEGGQGSAAAEPGERREIA